MIHSLNIKEIQDRFICKNHESRILKKYLIVALKGNHAKAVNTIKLQDVSVAREGSGSLIHWPW